MIFFLFFLRIQAFSGKCVSIIVYANVLLQNNKLFTSTEQVFYAYFKNLCASPFHSVLKFSYKYVDGNIATDSILLKHISFPMRVGNF